MMYPPYLCNHIIKETQTIAECCYKFKKQAFFFSNTVLIVLDSDERYIGSLTECTLLKYYNLEDGTSKTAGEVCDRNGVRVEHTPESRLRALVKFADEPSLNAVPVIDGDGNLIDIIFRQQAFYKDFYNRGELPRMHYAKQIYGAANLAKSLGYPAVSVIEFGVSGGNGLINCEFHVKEISRLVGIDIELYGFDGGEGLPYSDDYRDMLFSFGAGYYPMDIELLQKRLQFAKLVIGNIKDTSKSFINNRAFAPIGAMFVDVDMYTSTVPILDMLLNETSNFLPRVFMYFDDLFNFCEHVGEALAISEFNKRSDFVKISRSIPAPSKLYQAHLFKHEKYNTRLSVFHCLNLR